MPPPRPATSDRSFLLIVALGAVLFALSTGIAIALHRYIVAALVAALGVRWLYRRIRQAGRRRARIEAAEAERRSWTEIELEPGSFSVILQGFEDRPAEGRVAGFVSLLPGFRERPAQVDELVERVRHLAPQPIAEEISEQDAARLRAALEERGGQVEVLERSAVS